MTTLSAYLAAQQPHRHTWTALTEDGPMEWCTGCGHVRPRPADDDTGD